MSKKDSFYFDNFVKCIRVSLRGAERLREIIAGFDSRTLESIMEEMHEIEHAGDVLRHELVSEIVRAFITPVDRDDLIRISQSIDSVTDSIEEIVLHFYTWNITSVRSDAAELAELMIQCCRAVEELLLELPDYRRSERLLELVVEVNRLEEEGDRMYIGALHRLSLEVREPLSVMAWREIYQSFETVFDCCEAVANVVEAISIANS